MVTSAEKVCPSGSNLRTVGRLLAGGAGRAGSVALNSVMVMVVVASRAPAGIVTDASTGLAGVTGSAGTVPPLAPMSAVFSSVGVGGTGVAVGVAVAVAVGVAVAVAVGVG